VEISGYILGCVCLPPGGYIGVMYALRHHTTCFTITRLTEATRRLWLLIFRMMYVSISFRVSVNGTYTSISLVRWMNDVSQNSFKRKKLQWLRHRVPFSIPNMPIFFETSNVFSEMSMPTLWSLYILKILLYVPENKINTKITWKYRLYCQQHVMLYTCSSTSVLMP
jgi:hypothetical protein